MKPKNADMMVPLRHLSNFWRTLEIRLINCEIYFILKWSKICLIPYYTAANQVSTFAIIFQLQLYNN